MIGKTYRFNPIRIYTFNRRDVAACCSLYTLRITNRFDSKCKRAQTKTTTTTWQSIRLMNFICTYGNHIKPNHVFGWISWECAIINSAIQQAGYIIIGEEESSKSCSSTIYVCKCVEFCLRTAKPKTPRSWFLAREETTKAKLLKFRHKCVCVCEMGCIGRCADVLLCVVVAVKAIHTYSRRPCQSEWYISK